MHDNNATTHALLPAVNHAGPESVHVVESRELSQCLEEACGLPEIDVETCHWLRRKLTDATFNLVVVGQFKRGKSSLINALLGETLLPVGVVPLTSVVTVIQFDPVVSASIVTHGEVRRDIPLDSLEEYVTERGNPKNAKGVEEVLICYPCPWLAAGVRLIDTPGVESVYTHNSKLTHAYLPQADAVIFVASVEQPFSQAELAFLHDIRQYASKVFCVLNKIDYLSAAELAESVAFCTAVVHEALETPITIFPLSARWAMQDERTETFHSTRVHSFQLFKSALEGFLFTDKNAVWRRTAVRTLLRVLSQARFALELERSVVATPLQQLDASLEELRIKKYETLRDQAEQLVLLQAQARLMLKEEVEPELERFRKEQQNRIVGRITAWYNSHRKLPLRKLQSMLTQKLDAEVRAIFNDWIAREEPKLRGAFDALSARFWSQTQQRVDDLLHRCSELFRVPLEAVESASLWRYESRFGYKFWSEPTSLSILSSSAPLALPRAIGDPLMLRQLRSTAMQLIDMHAGRLRSDIEERLRQSVESFRTRLLTSTTTIVDRIEEAVVRGKHQYARNKSQMSARDAQIVNCIVRIDAIATRVRRVA